MESSVQNSALLQFGYLTLGPKLCLEYLSNPLQINFLATGTLAANDFHSALPYARAFGQVFKLFLLVSMVYVLCYPINVSYLLHCCLYLSLSLFSKGGCAQCQGAWILRS